MGRFFLSDWFACPVYATSFALRSVSRMNGNPGNWFPGWPSGTEVVHAGTGITTRKPFSQKEIGAIRRLASQNRSGTYTERLSRWMRTFWIPLCGVAIAACLACIAVRTPLLGCTVMVLCIAGVVACVIDDNRLIPALFVFSLVIGPLAGILLEFLMRAAKYKLALRQSRTR